MLRDVSVREVMNGDYVGISECDGLVESVELLLAEEADVGIVLRGNEVVGAVTERDALSRFVEDDAPDAAEVSAAMTESVQTIRPDRGLHEARDRMTTAGTHYLVVAEGDEPLGVVTEHDLLAGSTLGTEPPPEDEREAESAVMTPSATAAGAEMDSASEDAFSDQGICEVCGTMTADLSSFNGQLRCSDCRDV